MGNLVSRKTRLGFDHRPAALGLYDPRFERDACGMGFVVNVKGRRSHAIVCHALTALENMSHRGAQGSEPDCGDGAGIMLQVPHEFLKRACAQQEIQLPDAGSYGVGMVFLPQDATVRHMCERAVEAIVVEEGQRFLGWRTVPTDNTSLGATSRASEPIIRQLFVGKGSATDDPDPMAFERRLYVIRKRAEKELGQLDSREGVSFYVASLSARTIVYKGMLLSEQLRRYYPDLSDSDMKTALALIHSRFSTNTFPSWKRAHPYRYIIHNGEINTLRGNVNWMQARQTLFESAAFGNELEKLLPVIDPDGSDSAIFDNTLEFLVMNGRSLPHAIMMMIPEPWQKHESMDGAKRAFYEYHSCLMEPWDGPASIGFTDGVRVGAVLDRNGLRPSRYYVTKDDLVIMASEVGVLDVPPDKVLYKGRLQPGRMFLVDTELGRIVSDEELKRQIAEELPYPQWLDDHLISVDDLAKDMPDRSGALTVAGGAGANANGKGKSSNRLFEDLQGHRSTSPGSDAETLRQRQQAFGYTYEDLRIILVPTVQNGVEPLGSMGDDTPLAVLSHRPQLLFNYFKQLFAQVTNPPLDAIREELITSSETLLGSEGNLLSPKPGHCRRIRLKTPILTNAQLDRLSLLDRPGLKSTKLPIVYPVAAGGSGLEAALEELFRSASQALDVGANILILSDRGIDQQNGAMPALLAIAGMHHHLIRQGTRSRASLVLESGEPREVHHFAVLLGYGADAINPYLAFETIIDIVRRALITDVNCETALANYAKAILKGVVKVMSKMGISTMQSYRGAQIFEAIGLHQSVIEKYFTWTPSRIGGAGMDVLAEEAYIRHSCAFPERPLNNGALPEGGHYQWRQDGEHHLFSPSTIEELQTAVRTGDYGRYQWYAQAVNDQSEKLYTLRGLMKLKFIHDPLPLDEVEPVESICRRFKTGAMSYGSISQEAHESLAIAMNRLGGRSNSGEGGEDPARYQLDKNGDSRNSAIKQVASGRFGVTSEYLTRASEIQIKMAQGAKPGEGGQLPGRKVYPWIASVRHSTPGVGLISPPPHHDIYSIEDLAQLIHDLKCANPQARINVKLVSEVGVGTIAAGVAKGKADVILISGHDGGTGASPQSSIKHSGSPWELGLAETQQTLMLNNLRTRVRLETDGQLKTGRDVVVAALLGAEEFGFATAPLVALGCLMMRVCHLNTCPVGIATQNPELRARFTGSPEYVESFMRFVAQDVRELMARLGFHTVDEMVGRTDKLEARQAISHWKARGLDLSRVLNRIEVGGRSCTTSQDHNLESTFDSRKLLDLCRWALSEGRPVKASLPIRNTDRVVGTLLGGQITRKYGRAGLPEDKIWLHFQGSAGQSFGAFIPPGLTLELEGDANDYVGKGLSGGKIIVYPPEGSTFVAEDNIIVGNVAFYGSTSGEAYIRGIAGERFCVRNSGAKAVVEGVGDHGCEYMTGGRVVILGKTGRNFAAGMSGGVAYVLDEAGDFRQRCNQDMVWLERLEDEEESLEVKGLIQRHARYTRSRRAQTVLQQWETMTSFFVKVMPKDYKRALAALADVEERGLSGEASVMAAFEANMKDAARISGN